MNIGSHENFGKKSVFWTFIRCCPSPPLVGWRTAASWLDRCNVVIAVPPRYDCSANDQHFRGVRHCAVVVRGGARCHNHVIGSYLSLSLPPLLLVGAPCFAWIGLFGLCLPASRFSPQVMWETDFSDKKCSFLKYGCMSTRENQVLSFKDLRYNQQGVEELIVL